MKNLDNTNENITKFDGILSLLLIIFINNIVLILRKNIKDNMYYIFAGSHISSEYSLRGTFQLSKHLVVRSYNLFIMYIFYFLTYKKTKNILYVSVIHCLWDFLPEL